MRRLTGLLLIFVCFSLASGISSRHTAQAQTISWLTANPTIGQRQEIEPNQLPTTIGLFGNIPCSPKNFAVREEIPPLQPAQTATACAVFTAHGAVASGGYTNVFKKDARLHSSAGGPISYYAIPGGTGGVALENTADGTRLHYYSTGILSARKDYNSFTRELKVYMPDFPSWTLKDRSGKVLHIRPDSLAFSSNGQWLVADSPHLATLRVNLLTGEVTPFSSPYAYHLGLSVMPNLAISDDGATAVMTSERGDFKVVDVASCAAVPDKIIGPVSCLSQSHEAFLRSNLVGYFRVFQPRFLSDQRLSFFFNYTSLQGVFKLAKIHMAPNGQSLQNQDYLALGDSFTSGEGAYDYFAETDTTENNCHLSHRSYPYLIGQQLNLVQFNSAACSGAKIDNITTFVQKQDIPSPNSMGRLLPGYKKQIQYVHDQNPDVITVSIGGNDIGFGDIIKKCVGNFIADTCFKSHEDRLELVRRINRQFEPLTEMFTQLKQAVKPNGKIYAIGYPHIVMPGGDCALNVRLDEQEIIFAEQTIDYLNQIIELSANKAGVRYVDVSKAFHGHRMCENFSGLVAFNGITLGDDTFGILGSESYHPNQLGHQLYRQKILQQTNNFTAIMSDPDPNATLPAENSSLDLLAAPPEGRQIRQSVYDHSITAGQVSQSQSLVVETEPFQHHLQPNSPYQVSLHSDPVDLGTFTTDQDGTARATIKLPGGLPTGFHSLHILATDIFGQAVDIHKTIFILGDQPFLIEATADQFKSSAEDQPSSAANQITTKENPFSAKPPEDHPLSLDTIDTKNVLSKSSPSWPKHQAVQLHGRWPIKWFAITIILTIIGLFGVTYAYKRSNKIVSDLKSHRERAVSVLTIILMALWVANLIGYYRLPGLESIAFSVVVMVPFVLIAAIDLILIIKHLYRVSRRQQRLDPVALVLILGLLIIIALSPMFVG